MRSLRLKKDLPEHYFVHVVDCDGCGIECAPQAIYEVEVPGVWSTPHYCITCLHERHPECVEVIE